MTAAEIAKLTINGNATTANRVYFQPRDPSLFLARDLPVKQGCMCQTRDNEQYREAISGSRFAELSS